MLKTKTQYLIVGSGILGLSIARELLLRGDRDILLLEKEPSLGVHASGRNSGVLHSGLYYGSESLKAKFCLKGNYLMREFCQKYNLPVIPKGKIIITKNEFEVPALMKLYEQAKKNFVPVELISENDVSKYEPYASTVGKALYSPQTAIVSPQKILVALQEELLLSKKVRILFSTRALKRMGPKKIMTNHGPIEYEYFINTAGSYADQLAHQFNLATPYQFIPFRGQYKKLKKDKTHLVQANIYPVPHPDVPFLGIHFTHSVDGHVYIGPNAFPALGREHYQGVNGIDLEAFPIIYRIMNLYFKNKKFRSLTHQEITYYSEHVFWEEAKKMIPSLQKSDIISSHKVGIRPQLINSKTRELVMDFLLEQDEESLHVLNAISPAFTSSLSFANYIVDKIPNHQSQNSISGIELNGRG